MSRSWNGKAVIDRAAVESWDTSTTFRAYLIDWANEIMDDIATRIPQDYFLHKLEKLLPTNQEIVNLSPNVGAASTVAISTGGSLTEDSVYKVYTTFVIYDKDLKYYIESEESVASAEVTATSSDKTIDVSDIPTYEGISETVVYRNIYVATKADGETSFGEPFFHSQIADNTTTTASITSEPSSTITPPSDTEVDQIAAKHMTFADGYRYLQRIDQNKVTRYDPDPDGSTQPESFDFYGLDSIFLYPKLSASATTNQRTLTYYVHRRPHEIFYDVDREIDLPIQAKRALIQGIIWKAHQFRDRDGYVSKRNEYEASRDEFLKKITRQKGAPSSVRDINGDVDGFEVG